MTMTRRFVLTACAAPALALFPRLGRSAPPPRLPLVDAQPGNLPIILCAPHGGTEAIPGVPPRSGAGVRLFNPRRDLGTARLTERVADSLENLAGTRPYLVIARFHRKFVDANRPADLAYDAGQPHAAAAYQRYHAAVAAAHRDVAARWGRGILLDIHGQRAAPRTIFRGTRDGTTARALVTRCGRDALTGRRSLVGRLDTRGLRVSPAVGATDREDPRYNGGFTVARYGSGNGGTVDAIQLEIGRELRSPRANTAQHLAAAIAGFCAEFLPHRAGAARH